MIQANSSQKRVICLQKFIFFICVWPFLEKSAIVNRLFFESESHFRSFAPKKQVICSKTDEQSPNPGFSHCFDPYNTCHRQINCWQPILIASTQKFGNYKLFKSPKAIHRRISRVAFMTLCFLFSRILAIFGDGTLFHRVSDPYSLNPDPAKILIRIQAIVLNTAWN